MQVLVPHKPHERLSPLTRQFIMCSILHPTHGSSTVNTGVIVCYKVIRSAERDRSRDA